MAWAGTAGERGDAALVLVDDSPHWQPPAGPVRWGRLVTTRPGARCETWGVPDEAQRPRLAVEAEQLAGRINPGTGFVNNQYVMDLDQHPPHWSPEGAPPWGGLSGAGVLCGPLLTGVVAADRAHSGHARLNVIPTYVLTHDPAFRAALLEHGGGTLAGLEGVEFQALTDPAQTPGARPTPATPAALLEAWRQIVPFHGRHDLLAELTAWCDLGEFGAWLLHGPGGQGKTRLAHHLADLRAADGWTVLWPRAAATADQLAAVRYAARPLLVVLDYAETRTHQLTALVEAAAQHPGATPLKLLLLARTEGDWWRQTTTESRLTEHYLATVRTHRLAPLEDDPLRRSDHYREAAGALAAVLPQFKHPIGQDQGTPVVSALPDRDLTPDAYGNALTLQMTALADLLDATRSAPEHARATADEAEAVEDRLLAHERRYWRHHAVATGLTPALSIPTLEVALAAAHLAGAADRDQADRLWQRLPALADQPRDRRDCVTAWLAALYPPTTGASLTDRPPWGALQPDRLAERHAGRTLEADPHLADRLLDGADDTQIEQFLTVYSRAGAHPALRLDTQLIDLCVRRHHQLAQHIVATATRTDHPQPLIDALDAIATSPDTPRDTLAAIYDRFPHASHRLATTAARLTLAITRRYRTLAEANPDVYLPDLAMALNNLSYQFGGIGWRAEGLTAAQEAVTIRRTLAEANRDAYLPNLANSLNNLSTLLGEAGRSGEGLTTIQEATGYYRTLAEANPDVYLPDLALALNNLSTLLGEAGRSGEGLTAIQEATSYYRTLAEANPDAYLPDLALTLNNLSTLLGDAGRSGEGLTAIQEATGYYRTLAEANPDAYLPNLAMILNTLALRSDDLALWAEGLAAIQEAVTIRRALAAENPDAYLPDLADSLNNLSTLLGRSERWTEGLTAVQEATGYYHTLALELPDRFEGDLQRSLEVTAWLKGRK
ncbi:hypothetical protein [Kitasatospora sp. NPDC058046]|uniref:hypothetical protein n=1 Tax=Kitasatospora sp. NPDC058046 TaxID=3346312 RepID=UPI0036DB58E9